MLWIALAAAAQLGAAQPTAPLFGRNDFPAFLDASGVSRRVFVRVTIGPDADLKSCQIEMSSGDTRTDQYTCELVKKHGHFRAARWIDGSPVFGVIRLPVDWVTGSPFPRTAMHGDLDVTVNRLPDGAPSPDFERLILAVDEEGHITKCEGDEAWAPGMDKNDPQLAQVACDALTKSYKPVIPRDATSKPEQSVQNALVRFDKQR
jgi:hypothetical protein